MRFLPLFLLISIACIGDLMATTVTQDLVSPMSTDASYAFWSGTAITTYLLITEDQISDVATKKQVIRGH